MSKWNYVLMALSMLIIFNSSYANPTDLNNMLSTNKNPVLSPQSLKFMPYTKLFLEMDVVPMIVWNSKGGLIAANDAYLKMIGYTRDEMQTRKIDWANITPPEYTTLDQNCIKQLKNRDYCTPYVKEYIHKSGNRIAIKLWNAHAMVKDGQNIAIILPLKPAELTS